VHVTAGADDLEGGVDHTFHAEIEVGNVLVILGARLPDARVGLRKLGMRGQRLAQVGAAHFLFTFDQELDGGGQTPAHTQPRFNRSNPRHDVCFGILRAAGE
jgi:hypothetical protein